MPITLATREEHSESTGAAYSDAEYIREIAAFYKGSNIADFKAHYARLTAIADWLAAEEECRG